MAALLWKRGVLKYTRAPLRGSARRLLLSFYLHLYGGCAVPIQYTLSSSCLLPLVVLLLCTRSGVQSRGLTSTNQRLSCRRLQEKRSGSTQAEVSGLALGTKEHPSDSHAITVFASGGQHVEHRTPPDAERGRGPWRSHLVNFSYLLGFQWLTS